MRIGGLIIADNVLWSGEVLEVENGKTDDESTIALHKYQQKNTAGRKSFKHFIRRARRFDDCAKGKNKFKERELTISKK